MTSRPSYITQYHTFYHSFAKNLMLQNGCFLVKPYSVSHTKGQSLIIPVDTAVSNCGEVVFLSSKMPSPSQCNDEYDEHHSVVEQCSGCLHFAEENIGSCQAPPLPGGGGGAVGWGGIRREGGSAWRQKDPSTTFTFILL